MILNAALLSHLLDFYFEIGGELLLVLKLLLQRLLLMFQTFNLLVLLGVLVIEFELILFLDLYLVFI